MAKRRRDLSALGASGRAAAQSLVEQDREVEERRAREGASVRLLKIEQIKDRPNPETRKLRPKLVLELLCSIDAMGLIEPLAVDRKHRLLAGGHRLMALRMLSMSPKEALERFEALSPSQDEVVSARRILEGDPERAVGGIPVHVFDFDSAKVPERAFSIETAENTVRRDYTPTEVKALYERMRGMKGFSTKGRPKRGERAVIPELAAILGKSAASIHRYLQAEAVGEGDADMRKRVAVRSHLKTLSSAVRRLERDACELEGLEQLIKIIKGSAFKSALERAQGELEGERKSLK